MRGQLHLGLNGFFKSDSNYSPTYTGLSVICEARSRRKSAVHVVAGQLLTDLLQAVHRLLSPYLPTIDLTVDVGAVRREQTVV